MKKDDFHFDLPEELIAQHPLAERTASRLLCLNKHSGALAHRQFSDLPDLLEPGDLLVFNNTRVIPARLFATKPTGGRVEVMLERVLPDNHCMAQLRVSKKPAVGMRLQLDEGGELEVMGRQGAFYRLHMPTGDLLAALEAQGHMPLPPYITRADIAQDRERYQTVYAAEPGAVAAPTAGLHFDTELFAALDQKGIQRAYVTLHVGAGTFQPVRAENIEDHQMHSEYLEVPQAVCDAVEVTKARGGRVVAVGTTSVRSLETAAASGRLQPFSGDSDIFIYPGYEFKVVDAMITNFHLPESTLIMLVSAFAGRSAIQSAYAEAVKEKYRFFSYGDAMLLI